MIELIEVHERSFPQKLDLNMIIWRLNEVMAEKRITGKDLSDLIGVHPNTISRLRRSKQMLAVDGEMLNKLCNTLECTPTDLIEYTRDLDNQEAEVTAKTVNSSDIEKAAEAAQKVVEEIGAKDPSVAAKVALSVMQTLLKASPSDMSEMNENAS